MPRRFLLLSVLAVLAFFDTAVAAESTTDAKLKDGFYRAWDEDFAPPEETVVLPGEIPSAPPVTLLREPLLLATEIERAEAKLDVDGYPVLAIELTDRGGERMKIISAQLNGKRMALVVANKIVTAPVIYAAVGKQLQVSGNFTMAETRDLARQIMSR